MCFICAQIVFIRICVVRLRPCWERYTEKITEKMCLEAGISEKKTNHSLRATGASALFNASVPEKLIRDVTGHRSNALQLYEKPSLKQKQKVLVQGANEFSTEKESTPVQEGSSNLVPGPRYYTRSRISWT